MRRSKRPNRDPMTSRDDFVLGRTGFARISAVEGIVLTAEMRAMLDGFDRDRLSAEERRARIVDCFTSGKR
ncbi:MAG: hypothetical protein PW843_07570 [Azospirillaceae bacterium]|nr:hypothetical protein [Azospirillaceae bacterium]